MKKKYNKFIIGGLILLVLFVAGYMTFFQSIIKYPYASINYFGHVYDCGSDSLDLRHNTWATQNDLLKMCQMCVLEYSYPLDDPHAQMFGDCEWWTSSTTGQSRYRYRAVPLDSTSCGDINIPGNGTAENAAQVACYQGKTFAQLVSWSNQVSYCPNNPESYIRSSGLAACYVAPPINITLVCGDGLCESNEVCSADCGIVPGVSNIPIWYWIAAGIFLVSMGLLIWKYYKK
jgi:hypothetical protein